jgi:hypothetical protein
MTHYPGSLTPVPQGKVLKMCPWCRGPLGFEPYYPVMRLVPGDARMLREEDIPPTLRTVAAWVCKTQFCKYREKA